MLFTLVIIFAKVVSVFVFDQQAPSIDGAFCCNFHHRATERTELSRFAFRT